MKSDVKNQFAVGNLQLAICKLLTANFFQFYNFTSLPFYYFIDH